jgi:hypothetical protein
VNEVFRDFLKEVTPIRLREPLAETLGALKAGEDVLEYSFIDVLKMAGHACPTVSGAYLCCQQALEELYGEDIPVRGEIGVTVYGNAEEGVYGVMAQVFSFLTGAASATGFKGLGPRFKRKDLLRFEPAKIDQEAMCFEFSRLDNGRSALVKFYPQRIPFPADKSRRMGQLMQPVVWEAAREEEIEQFRELWMEKVRDIVVERKDIDQWLKVESKEAVK